MHSIRDHKTSEEILKIIAKQDSYSPLIIQVNKDSGAFIGSTNWRGHCEALASTILELVHIIYGPWCYCDKGKGL